MAEKSGIHWTDSSWNAATGCTKVSAGCDHCYANDLALRLQRMGQWRYRNGFDYTEHPEVIGLPRKWREPRRIFVNSMSDMFHEHATRPFVWAMLDMMREVDRHTYQILTKRPGKMASWVRLFCQERGLAALPWHIWVGTSVEDQAAADLRIPQLLKVPATVRFLSCEPLLGEMNVVPYLGTLECCDNCGQPKVMAHIRQPGDEVYLGWPHCGNSDCPCYREQRASASYRSGVDWVIGGGESGRDYRPMDPAWARSLRDQCAAAEVPFFFKQSSGLKPGQGRELDGRLYEAFPEREPMVQEAMF